MGKNGARVLCQLRKSDAIRLNTAYYNFEDLFVMGVRLVPESGLRSYIIGASSCTKVRRDHIRCKQNT